MSRWGFVYAEKEQRGGRRTDGNLPLALRFTQNLGELRRWLCVGWEVEWLRERERVARGK
jgi:hypothetical protein